LIPSTAHFIWLGRSLPWLTRLAPVSAAHRGEFDRVVFHHEADLDPTAIQFLSDRIENLELRQIPACSDSQPGMGPTARSNLLRLRILRDEGGVYLDMDTLTVSSFAPLLDKGFFCGTEAVVFSAAMRRSRNPAKWAGAVGKTMARRICRWLPSGWRFFRKLEPFYEHRPNNAVLGAIAGHPVLSELVARSERRAVLPGIRPKDIGVRLLQELLDEPVFMARSDIETHGPDRFYPLPPDICAHWFRSTDRLSIHEIIATETRSVHWYASLIPSRISQPVDKFWIEANRNRVPLARLVTELDLPL
jgi:hypothetical protein